MNKLSSLCILLAFFAVVSGCHSAKKSLKRGDYDDSVFRAADKLKSNPAHSASMEILKQAFPSAVAQHLDDISKNDSEPELPKWELLLSSYQKLNKLYNAVNLCAPCVYLVSAKNYFEEERNSRQKLVEVHYSEGAKLLAKGERSAARIAYEHFERVQELNPNYNDIEKRLETSYSIASFKVVVEQVAVTSKAYQLSNANFQDRIDDFLKDNHRLNKFVRFYTPDEATNNKLTPDHVITLQFDDFVVGQTLIEKNTETVVSKDSVKIGEKVVNRNKITFYDKVSAKLTKTRKTIHSSGLLDMRVVDFNTKRQINQEKFSGEYDWVCEWASFNGDERALSPFQIRMCKSQELLPPDAQQLFAEFSKPIFDRLTDRLMDYYSKY
ncbi:hypothetical protein L0657_02295 [Dyadobacter sp. CY345]|uniref:hypothetical protein n=1 Tax=Dyadobacter sp. CY345 TaxID=2909335 RepID=UPI001F16F37D|nr:hypothetical protein [Dyadobacter sp. CY345]MCF2442771.1 hypothetical protein [Dyadobacter sp. CY345]